MLRPATCALFLASFIVPAIACPDGEHEACVLTACWCEPDLDTPSVSLPDLPGLDGLAQRAANEGNQALRQAADNVNEYVKGLTDGAKSSIEEAFNGASDTARNLVEAANDIVDAAKAVGRFAEREINGEGDILSDAERRIREGKVVDAIWHIGTGKLQHTNRNAAQLAQENELVNQAAAVAAATYGGPAGAAAYAAWKTYNDTGGNLELALKAGAYAYTVKRYGDIGPISDGSISKVAKQAATTGAIAGLAVAAKGGSTQESLDAFVEAGGAVVVQAGQAYVKKQYTDPAMAEADIYCTSLLDAGCAEASGWVDKSREFIENPDLADGPNIKVTADGNWAIGWNKSALESPETNVPGVALTYIGAGSPFHEQITELAKLGNEDVSDLLPLNVYGWVYLGRYLGNGEWEEPRANDLLDRSPEDITDLAITLNREVNLRSDAFEITRVREGPRCSYIETPIVGRLPLGAVARIVNVVRLQGCSSYVWAEVEER